MSLPVPPRLAAWVLSAVVAHPEVQPILGDLQEEYVLVTGATSGPRARWWYVSQVARSILPLIAAVARRADWGRTLAGAVGGYAVAMAVGVGGAAIALALLAHRPAAALPTTMAIDLASSVLGGYLAARIHPMAATIQACLSLLIVIALMVTIPDSAPLWYQVFFLIFGPPAVLAGGILHRRTCSC
jgi:hypothetical protein